MDEFCFLRVEAPQEVLPMTLTGAHMVVASSHRMVHPNCKPFLDLANMHCTDILVNNVPHVCPQHIRSMIEDEVTAMCCPCYLFSQSPHIKADASYRRTLNAFIKNSAGIGKEDGDTASTIKTAMLSEIGILLPNMGIDSLKSDVGLDAMRLAAPNARQVFCTKSVAVEDYVVHGERQDMIFSRSVVAYIDPAPTDVGRSYNAIVFVAKAEYSDVEVGTARLRERYVIIAAEEFQSDWLEPESQDGMLAIARVFMSACHAITRFYKAYFNRIIVAPEANGLSVNHFWMMCGRLYAKSKLLLDKNVAIYSTTIPSATTKSLTNTRRAHAISRRFAKKPVEVELALAKSTERIVDYRIGYLMTKDKTDRITKFYTNCYNPSKMNIHDVVCARSVWSWWLTRQGYGVPLYIAGKMDMMYLRAQKRHHTGHRQWYVTGKGTRVDGSHEADDLAIAVAMSTTLSQDFHAHGEMDPVFRRLLRLEPRDELNGMHPQVTVDANGTFRTYETIEDHLDDLIPQ